MISTCLQLQNPGLPSCSFQDIAVVFLYPDAFHLVTTSGSKRTLFWSFAMRTADGISIDLGLQHPVLSPAIVDFFVL